jgi:hypothetical protein
MILAGVLLAAVSCVTYEVTPGLVITQCSDGTRFVHRDVGPLHFDTIEPAPHRHPRHDQDDDQDEDDGED